MNTPGELDAARGAARPAERTRHSVPGDDEQVDTGTERAPQSDETTQNPVHPERLKDSIKEPTQPIPATDDVIAPPLAAKANGDGVSRQQHQAIPDADGVEIGVDGIEVEVLR